MVRKIPRILLEFLISAEALKTRAYQDSKGVWTIGVGHTGPEVRRGLVWTVEQCMRALVVDATDHAELLEKRIGADIIAELSEHQYAALVSFVFNLGAGPKWTIWKVLKRRQFDAVPAQLKRFNKITLADGRVKTLPGLIKRRAAEVQLYETPDVMAPTVAMEMATPLVSAEHIPSSEIRRLPTPPELLPRKPLVHSKSFMTTGASGIAGIFAAATSWIAENLPKAQGGAKAALDQIQPFAGGSDAVATMASTLTTVCAVLAVAALAFQLRKHEGAKH